MVNARLAPRTEELRPRLNDRLVEHRALLLDGLDGLAEDDARRSLGPYRRALSGLVKHVTDVESAESRAAVGVPDGR